MDGNGGKILPCTEMSPGLDSWRLEVQCSSNYNRLMLPYRDAAGPEIVPEKKIESPTALFVEWRMVEGHQKESEKGHVGVIEGDESSTNDNIKVVRSFKFVLVEHIRDLLKPYWKHGNLSRDAYKIIMKKSVDKIIESIGTSKVPKTENEQHRYISASKTKIFDFVQAYVKRYRKWENEVEYLFRINTYYAAILCHERARVELQGRVSSYMDLIEHQISMKLSPTQRARYVFVEPNERA